MWIRTMACAAAALAFASYAAAAPVEAQLGTPVKASRGTPFTGHESTPAITVPGKIPAARFRHALDALSGEEASTTRGATESSVYRRAAPAVVLIVTEEGLGSGVLISADGQIVTNLHVVRGAKQIGVAFKPALEGTPLGEGDLRAAKLLKVDEVADLALIQVAAVPAGVKPLALGDSSRLQVGADVHAIGHPTGEAWTYTRGIVSQIRRAYDWSAEDKVQHEATVVQTQTPINPGNSGGPLLDDQANVVGINSFTGEGEGMNYAVSVEDVKSFLARAHDRAAAPLAPPKSCDWKTIRIEEWKDPVGKAEMIDSDCDGQIDAALFEPANKRAPYVLMRDESGHGEYDTMYFDANHDGDPEYVIYDSDGDGQPDLRGDCRQGADAPYRWTKLDR